MRTFPRGLKGSNPNEWFNNNRVNIPGMKEVIWEPLYHKQTVAAAGGPQNLTFFQDQNGVNGNTLSDTNMDLQGQVPKGKAFLCTGIQIEIFSLQDLQNNADASGIQDLYNFWKTGNLVFRIGSKEYLRQAPFGAFPPTNRMHAYADLDGAASTIFSYAVETGREFAIRDLLLESNQNFSVTLNDIPNFTFDNEIIVKLNGFMARNAQ